MTAEAGENPLRIVLTGKAILAILLATVVVGASAAFVFTQHFPAIPATAPPAVIISNCGTSNNLVTSTTSVVSGGSTTGYILFTCPSDTAAITSSAVGGIATPTFTLPPGYVSLLLQTHTAGATTCAGGQLGISTGSQTTFGANENWDYCASYTMVPASGLAAFDITWNG